MLGLLPRLLRDRRGASAVEFAIVAPVLIAGLLAMVDVGLGLGMRMELDRIVRAGAQAAISLNNDASAIEALVLASSASPDDLSVEVERVCSCGGVAASCTALCSGGTAPSVYYEIDAERPHDGLVFGPRQVVSHARVKIR
jgi:Flp pilus assembly pilin Flp